MRDGGAVSDRASPARVAVREFRSMGWEFDLACGGSSDGSAFIAADGAGLTFELAHALDSADDSHDFSLRFGGERTLRIPAET